MGEKTVAKAGKEAGLGAGSAPGGAHVTFSLLATEITGARDPLTCVDSRCHHVILSDAPDAIISFLDI